MSAKSSVFGIGLSAVVASCALLFAPASAQERKAAGGPGQVLSDLAAGIIGCNLHPCLGDDERDVRRLLKGRLVSDGSTHYSDLGIAYPSVKGLLRGLVEWDFSDELDSVSLKITRFEVDPAVLIEQVQESLPGCEMERDSDEAEKGETDSGDEGDTTQEWSCLAERDGDDVLVEMYIGPGLLLFEIDP